ncbi:hypothetical protein [Serratia plymuthica]|uniref:hypothetical protein n=1 Tax=Serratia plymuthica TaxID=82996 RepID=UPI000B2F5C0A|nr:hypothetical protein [Serratia plymuthica]
MKSFQFAPGKLVDGQGRYDPFGTLSLITGFISTLNPLSSGFFIAEQPAALIQ